MNLIEQVTRRSLALAQRFSEDFSEYAMNSLVIITRPSLAVYNEDTRKYSQPFTTTIYDTKDASSQFTGVGAKAGITLTNVGGSYSVGDEPTYYSSITCYVPNVMVINPRIDDVVKVIFNVDPDLIGREFRVTDVPAGGRISTSTDLACTGIAPSRQWGP